MVNEPHEVVTWKGFHVTLMGLGPSVVLCRIQVVTQPTALLALIHIVARTTQLREKSGHHCFKKSQCPNFWPVLYSSLRIIWVVWVLIEKLKVQSLVNAALIPVSTKSSIYVYVNSSLWVQVLKWCRVGHRPPNARAPGWKWLTAEARVELSAQLKHHS